MKFDIVLWNKDRAELARKALHVGDFNDVTPAFLERAIAKAVAMADDAPGAYGCSFVAASLDGARRNVVDSLVRLLKDREETWRENAKMFCNLMRMRSEFANA